MRKLAWFVIIVFGLVLAVAIACAGWPDSIGKTVSSTLLSAGGGVLGGVHAGIQALANTVSSTVTYFTIYTLSTLIIGGILWIGVKKLWARRPAILQKQLVSQQYQGQPNYQPPQQIAAPQQVQAPTPKVEEKKLEATAA